MGVYRDKTRGTWFVKTSYTDAASNRKVNTKRGFLKKSDAVRYEMDFVLNHADDVVMSFDELVAKYKADKQPRLKESTFTSKMRLIEHSILPAFKDKRVCDITTRDVTKWQNSLIKSQNPSTGKPYKKSYLKRINDTLAEIFNYGIHHYGLKSNPVKDTEPIYSVGDSQMKFWTLDEFKKFIEVAKEDPMAALIFKVLYWTGMREGEMRALTRSDFDFDKGIVSISKTMHTVHGKDVVTSPKTVKSNRAITMPAFLCEELKDYVDGLYDFEEDRPIFKAPPYYLYRRMRNFCKIAGMAPIRIHDLRHSHVSLLISMHFSTSDIAERMGHESIDITFKYAHLFPSEQDAMAEELDRIRKGEETV